MWSGVLCRAGIVFVAVDYPWSSAAARFGVGDVPPWLDLDVWSGAAKPDDSRCSGPFLRRVHFSMRRCKGSLSRTIWIAIAVPDYPLNTSTTIRLLLGILRGSVGSGWNVSQKSEEAVVVPDSFRIPSMCFRLNFSPSVMLMINPQHAGSSVRAHLA